jgi:hypothetical protein
MAKLPQPPAPESYTQLKIIGQAWDIVWSPAWLNPGQYAHCDADGQNIVMRAGLRGMQCADALVHETLHAIDCIYGLDMTENQIRLMATGLTQVFLDNPEYFGFLAERFHEELKRNGKNPT